MSSRTNEYSFEAGRIANASISSVSGTVLAAEPRRRYAVICNVGVVDCYLAIGVPAEVEKGILLKAGGGSFELLSQNLTHAQINAIAVADSTSLSTQEGF